VTPISMKPSGVGRVQMLSGSCSGEVLAALSRWRYSLTLCFASVCSRSWIASETNSERALYSLSPISLFTCSMSSCLTLTPFHFVMFHSSFLFLKYILAGEEYIFPAFSMGVGKYYTYQKPKLHHAKEQ